MLRRIRYCKTISAIRSVPWRFVLLIFIMLCIPVIIIFHGRSIASFLETSAYTIGFIPLFFIMIISGCRWVLKLRRTQIHDQISGHICPHCKYSLIGLPCDKDQFSMCPECGIAWRLTKKVTTLSCPQYKRDFTASLIVIMSYVVYLIWSMRNGEELFSTNHKFLFCFTYGIIMMFLNQWMRNTIFISNFILPRGRDVQDKICPACDALIEDHSTNSDGITTCARCGAVWRLPDQD